MPTCEGCGGSYDDKYKFCPNCGRAAPEPKSSKSSEFAQKSMTACPKCHKDDNVAKVSSILQRDVHVIQSQIPVTTVRTNDSGAVTSDTYWQNVSSTQISSLAQTLLPPPPPVKNDFGYIWSIVVSSGIGLVILCCFPMMALNFIALPLNSAPEETGASILVTIFIVGMLIVASIILGGIAYYYVSKDAKYKKDYPSHRKHWEEAMLRYNQLYYCFRDDCVFVPGETTFSSPANTMTLIKWQPYSSKPPFRIFQF